ncbi:helix-turn-helix transcriptional regulator [Vogesella sp. GCM10023246]|uniref:HTH luxR-type domain-containing protein n=1 Tax=Vogesella oryzagri TaxID=3160864 RepID=A0ABV1M6I6_9NEIS
MLTAETRDSVIVGLYDSVLDTSQALPAIERLNSWLDCDGIHIIGWSSRLQSFSINLASRQIANHAGSYDNYYRQIDPRWPQVSRLPVGQILACHDFCDDRFVDRSEFFQDLMIPRGYRYTLGGNIFKDDSEEVAIAINYALGRDKFSDDKRQTLSQLMPHLGSWLRQLRHTETLRRAAWAGETGLEGMEQGVVLLNAERRILYLNKLAERFFPTHPGSERGQHALQESRQIDDAIRRVQLSRQPENLLATPRRHPEQPCVINILPVPQAGYSHGVLLPGFTSREELAAHAGRSHPQGLNLHPRGDVILLIRPKHRQTAASATSLAELFELTVAESRLARALALGASAEDYAQENGVSINTVRSQIRALLAKTGEDSLQDLLRLLALLPGV